MEGAISACEEIQTYELMDTGNGQMVTLLKEVVSNNQLNAAGRNFLMEKKYFSRISGLITRSLSSSLPMPKKQQAHVSGYGCGNARTKNGEWGANSENGN